MSFSDKQTIQQQASILEIKKKYMNKAVKPQQQQNSQFSRNNKNLPSKEKYYQSPSKYLNSIGQSNIQTINNYTSRLNQESNEFTRDYMTLKAEYTQEHRTENTLNANLKDNAKQNIFGNQSQTIQERNTRRMFNKANQVDNYRSQADKLASRWNKERNAKIKQLKQAQRFRANQGLDLKQKNHKVIDEIEQMVLRIKNNLNERIC